MLVETASDLHSSLFETLALPEMLLPISPFIRLVAIAFSLLIHFSCVYHNITKELSPLLSPGVVIIFLGLPEFLVAMDKDNKEDPPTFFCNCRGSYQEQCARDYEFLLQIGSRLCSLQNRYDMVIAIIYYSWQRLACIGEL